MVQVIHCVQSNPISTIDWFGSIGAKAFFGCDHPQRWMVFSEEHSASCPYWKNRDWVRRQPIKTEQEVMRGVRGGREDGGVLTCVTDQSGALLAFHWVWECHGREPISKMQSHSDKIIVWLTTNGLLAPASLGQLVSRRVKWGDTGFFLRWRVCWLMKCAPESVTRDNVYLCCDALLSDLPQTPLGPPDLQLTFTSQGIKAYMWKIKIKNKKNLKLRIYQGGRKYFCTCVFVSWLQSLVMLFKERERERERESERWKKKT